MLRIEKSKGSLARPAEVFCIILVKPNVLARVDDAVWIVQNRWHTIYTGFAWRVRVTELAVHVNLVVELTVSNPLDFLL